MHSSKWQGDRTAPAESVHTRMFDGELVILDLAHGEYFALDAVGSRLWEGLQQGKELDDVAHQIVADYDVSFEEARGDLETLACELLERGLIVRVGDRSG